MTWRPKGVKEKQDQWEDKKDMDDGEKGGPKTQSNNPQNEGGYHSDGFIEESSVKDVSNKICQSWGSYINNKYPNGRIWVMWKQQKYEVDIVEASSQTVYGKEVAGSQQETKDFASCIVDCGLEEVPFCGSYYTWSNKQGQGSRIYSKLDRVLANTEWMITHGMKTLVLEEEISDHCPLLIPIEQFQKRSNDFKYCDMWTLDPRSYGVIKEVRERKEEGMPAHEQYTPERGYKWLTGCWGLVWNRLTMPIHQFILWGMKTSITCSGNALYIGKSAAKHWRLQDAKFKQKTLENSAN
ncbi:hypothetical protein DM860_009812 [Cuscuta australis]|uniref:Endonuclease/exonuclease/phosphatase domain-containing protein n=1 Tax=Cuscuta australis TaxID=267555 RepID=A0A328DCS8_9ASTE|nr:hypothetical protein DM860_009812 [Cuscuta australis]